MSCHLRSPSFLSLDYYWRFQVVINHSVMHDLMHDLAQWAVGDLCCRLEVQLGGSKQSEISTKVHHFSYIRHSNDCIQKFDEDSNRLIMN